MRLLPWSRERLVLGPVLRLLDGDESVVAWAHATIPDLRAPAVLVVTDHHCLVHIANSAVPDISTPLTQLSSFTLERRSEEVVRVRLTGVDRQVEVELSLTSRVRSRSVGTVLATLTRAKVAGPDGFDPRLTSPLPPMVRRPRHHLRRVGITVLGTLVLLLAAVFSSPFVPGPGALTAVAGVAILAREYEWARDWHVWVARQVDRFLTWAKGLRGRRRGARGTRYVERQCPDASAVPVSREGSTAGRAPDGPSAA